MIQEAAYDALQVRIASKVRESDMPIEVVDASGLPWEQFDQPRDNAKLYTSRPALRQLVEDIYRRKPLPRAIGIDINFSSPDDDYYSPQDAAFLEFCSEQHEKYPQIPLVVGVGKSVGKGSKVLTDPRYWSLAASIQQPNPEEHKSFKRMYEWITVPYIQDDGVQVPLSFPSMARALAGRDAKSAPWPQWFANNVFDVRRGEVERKEFVVDYGPLDTLSQKSSSKDAGVSKIIIVARTDTRDQFAPPGQPHNNLPGVYAHYCAIYTLLLDKLPLCEVTEKGAVILDFLLALGLAWCVARVRIRHRKKNVELPPEKLRSMQYWFTIAGMGLAFLLGFVFVHLTRIMWDGFFLIMMSLAAHDALERTEWFEYLAAMLPRRIRSFLFLQQGTHGRDTA